MNKFALAFEICPMPLLLVSADGRIRMTNAELDEMFEYGPGELIGQPVEVLVPPEVRAFHPDLRQAFMRLPTKRLMGQGRDLDGITRTGRIVPIDRLDRRLQIPLTLPPGDVLDVHIQQSHSQASDVRSRVGDGEVVVERRVQPDQLAARIGRFA